MKELENEQIDKVLHITNQSVRHLMYGDFMYAIYITKKFKQMGWIAEIEGRYYGTIVDLNLKEKDDIIDYYLTLDKNAKETINQITEDIIAQH